MPNINVTKKELAALQEWLRDGQIDGYNETLHWRKALAECEEPTQYIYRSEEMHARHRKETERRYKRALDKYTLFTTMGYKFGVAPCKDD